MGRGRADVAAAAVQALFFFVLTHRMESEAFRFSKQLIGEVGHVASRHFGCTTSELDLTYFNTFHDFERPDGPDGGRLQIAKIDRSQHACKFTTSQPNANVPAVSLSPTSIEPWTALPKALSIRRRHLPPPLPIAMPIPTPQAQQLAQDLHTIRPQT